MQRPDFVSVLSNRFSDFVTFQCLGGVDARNQSIALGYFDRFLDRECFESSWPTHDVVLRYLASMEHLHPRTRCNRLSVVRQFCRYFRQFEPECYVPEPRLLIECRPSRIPHIYTDREIKDLLTAARNLSPAGSLRPQTYYTLFGLLYTTGLRCGEAFALNLSDVDLDPRLLFVRKGKFGKSRWVPISSSTCVALKRYIQKRARVAPVSPEFPLFVNLKGRRLYHTNVELAFRQALSRCGLRGGKGCPGPRIHDIRHTFACTRLLTWYRQNKNLNAMLPSLATYLGHVKVTSTQVYLRATAQLLEQANERFLRNFRQNISPKGD
jgi:integrase/recombinase XerD